MRRSNARSADQPPNCPSAQPALLIHVQPNARRTEVAGRHGDAIKIKVAAPPVNGAANAELIRFLAGRLRVPKAAVAIVSGAGSRRKQVRIASYQGDATAALLDRLPPPSPSQSHGPH